jgi:hypothetical protein
MVTFLHCSNNNRAATVQELLVDALAEYGIPRSVRCDKGLENVGVASFMLSVRGVGNGSVITGRSVHNQHIERLWRDVYLKEIGFYKDIFEEV